MNETNWNNIIEGAKQRANDPNQLLSNVFDNFFMPNLQQQAEFGQQVAFQEMQNNWNSEDAKMERMKKAGINANLAAAGIAGSGAAPSTGSPNSAVGAGAQGVASAAQAAGALNDAVNAGVNAYEKFSLTGVERDRRKSEIRDKLAAALHNEWLAYSISEMLPLQKGNAVSDIYLKLAQYANAREEYWNIQKEYEVKDAEVKRIKAERDLAVQQSNYVRAEELKVEAETAGIELDNWKKQRDKEWYEKYGYDRNNPIHNTLVDGIVSKNDDVVNAIGVATEQLAYDERKGFNSADIEDGFDKAFNAGLGNQASSAEYAEYRYEIDIAKMAVSAYLQALSSGDNNPASFVIQKIMAGSLHGVAEENDRNIKNKPHPKPRTR